MRPISLHHIALPDITADKLVRIAHGLACEHVCLFVQAPPQGWKFPTVEDAGAKGLHGLMEDCGITAYGVTSFAIFPQVKVETYKAGLERGARLGARYASVRVEDGDDNRATDAFARLAQLAHSSGLTASIEYTGYKRPELLARTLRIIKAAGRGAVSIDPLHIVRTGTLDGLRSVDPSLIGYVQLCDGPLQSPEDQYMHESAAERLPPGEGEFPLADILALAPPGRAVSLEVPSESLRASGMSPEDRARRVVHAARRFLSSAPVGSADSLSGGATRF